MNIFYDQKNIMKIKANPHIFADERAKLLWKSYSRVEKSHNKYNYVYVHLMDR